MVIIDSFFLKLRKWAKNERRKEYYREEEITLEEVYI